MLCEYLHTNTKSFAEIHATFAELDFFLVGVEIFYWHTLYITLSDTCISTTCCIMSKILQQLETSNILAPSVAVFTVFSALTPMVGW